MAAQVGEIELGVKLTGDDISKAISQISENIAKKFDKAFASLSGKFDDTSNDLKNAFSQASESIKSKVTKTSESVSQSVNKDLEDVQQQAKKSGSAINGAFRSATENINKKFTGVKQNIQSQVKGAGENIKSSLSKLGSAVVAAFSVATIKNFGQACIESAAGVSAANSQFAQTFGTMQEQASNAMQAVAKESGIVESRLQGVGTSIYAFAKTTGMDSANALSMMQDALQVTADSAAYYDRSLEDTAESLKSFLKGNFENDAALGLSCTETTRNAAANKLYGKSFIELSESQKQLTLLQMVKDANQLSGAMGQASREADGWENVTGNLKEAWNQFLAVVGQPILQVATQVVKQLSSALQTLTGYAKQATDALSKFFGWDTNNQTATAIGSASTEAKSLAKSADKSTDSLKKTEKTAQKLQNSLAGFDELNVLSIDNTDDSNDNDSDSSDSSNITTSSTTPVNSSTLNLKSDEKTYNEFGDKVKKVFEKINKAIEPVKTSLGKLKKQFDRLGKFAWEGLKDFYNDFLKPVGKWVLGEGLPKLIDIISTTMSNIDWDKINAAFDELWKALAPFAINVGEGLLWFVENVLSPLFTWTMNDVVPAFLKILSGAISVVNKVIEKAKPIFDWFWKNFLCPLAEWTGGVIVSVLNAIGDALSWISDNGTALDTITSAFTEWAETNEETIGLFFDNIQSMFADVANLLGGIMSDIGNILTDWWTQEGGGAEIFENVCKMFTDIGTTFMHVFNEWIKPAWDCLVSVLQSAWDNCLKPVFEQVVSVFGKIGEAVSAVWNNFLSPIVNWLVDVLAPTFQRQFDFIKSVADTVFGAIGGFVSGLLKKFGGIIDFITGVFTGDWKKAWKGICDYVQGTWDMIWSIIKGVVNLIIDGINGLWRGIYGAVKGIVDSIGSISGALGDLFGQDWHFSMPEEPPLIPKLARGGLVKAPTLALVGDNAGASTGDPEVVSPLSKLRGMIGDNDNSTADTQLLQQILSYLIKLYDMFYAHYQSGDICEISLDLDGDPVFKKIVQINNMYKKRHGGKSAFA